MLQSRFLTRDIVDGYLQLCFATLMVRHPDLRPYMAKVTEGVSIPSSYGVDGKRMALNIPVVPMLERFAREGSGKIPSLFSAFALLTSTFLIAMWAMLTETSEYAGIATEPEVQFFRHVRNGCAHGNRFNFDKLKYAAKWRDKEIRWEHCGSQVIPGMITYGDPIFLVADIQEKWFEPVGVPGYTPWTGSDSSAK